MDKSEENGQENRRIQIKPSIKVANQLHFNKLPEVVLSIIFQQFNYRELSNAATVCRKWLECADHAKNIRGPDCFKIHYNCAIGGFNFVRITQSPIKPFVGIFFLPYVECYNFNVLDIFKSLPTNCKTLILLTYTPNLNKYLNQLPPDVHCYMACALLPQISNVQLNMVIVHRKETYAEYIQMIETAASRQNHESSICLMLFCDFASYDLAFRMAELAESRLHQNERVSLCGGVVEQLITYHHEADPSYLTYCVAFLFTGSIRTWSIVLKEQTRGSSEEKLRIFKQQVQLRKHTVGFVFYSEKLLSAAPNVRDNELTIFKELFPNVPLVGCSCSIVFGRDTATYEAESLKPHIKQMFKESSITFMILTYG